MTYLYPWQDRARRLIEPLLARTDFRSTLERYREPDASWIYDADTQFLSETDICALYNLPENMHTFVQHLARTGELDYELLPAPVVLKDGPINKANVTIEISHNALRDDVKAFIEHEWSTISEKANRPKAWLGRPLGQVKETFYANRDSEIYDLYLQGLKPKELAFKTGLDDATIRQIIYRQNKKQKTRSIKKTVGKLVDGKVVIKERDITAGSGKEGERKQ